MAGLTWSKVIRMAKDAGFQSARGCPYHAFQNVHLGRGDLLAESAGVIFAFHEEDARDGRFPRRALEAALCLAAGAPT